MHSLLLLSLFALADAKGWLSPVYQNFFEFPLPVPPTAKPVKSYDNIDYYEIDIKPVDIEIYPGKKARHVGYDGIVPGPTFRMQQGREAVVRFINHADRANSVHLHGSYSRAPFDGWAEDTTEPGQYKDYYYPNAQAARTLWYHDHAVGHTAENAYYGQAGFYILEDAQKNALNLPSGNYDIPLALAAKRYNADGTLWDPEANGETTSVFGDVIQVNGQPWPYLAVEPRKYLFRFLDTSISRSFQLYAEADKKVGTRIPFTVIGSDAGLLASPVDTTQLDISMAERWEVVFDFSAYAGQNVTLKNTGKVGADDDFDGTDRVMRFMVGNSVSDTKGNGALPSTLRTVPMPPPKTGIDRSYEFMRSNGEWQVNGVTWADVEDRVIAKPQRGAVELWELKNGAGGWTHPIHIHLIVFKWCKDPCKKRCGPDHVVICEDGDFGHDMGDSSTHLATLVGFRNTQYADLAAVQRSSGPLGSFYVCIDCDNENLERLGCQTCLYRAAEVFSFTFDGRNDDGDIFVGVIRSVWDWGRFTPPKKTIA
ncbi:oxidase cueO precursor [Aureobasidium pullulans]|nr:oxidase cueO precursor [Aureobasidium pullulans]